MRNNYTLEEKIIFIKTAILKYVPAMRIYLFGSYAYGEPKQDSDVDIYVVIPDEFDDRVPDLWVCITSDLADIDLFEIDLYICHESRFNYRKTKSLFERIITNKGRMLYELN